jgi:hypothetical protein
VTAEKLPAPVMIGCVGCGQLACPDRAIWAQCTCCGKTCGVCVECGRAMADPWGFVDEGIRVHVARHHADLTLPGWRKEWLAGHTHRRAGHAPVELF